MVAAIKWRPHPAPLILWLRFPVLFSARISVLFKELFKRFGHTIPFFTWIKRECHHHAPEVTQAGITPDDKQIGVAQESTNDEITSFKIIRSGFSLSGRFPCGVHGT